MQAFVTTRESKEFVINRIVAEAALQAVPLSEIERRMLYFSETAWNPHDVALTNAEFEREYDTPAYEAKIAKLIASARTRYPAEQAAWSDALSQLSKEDHYLLVMANCVGDTATPGSFWRFLKLVLIMGFIAIVLVCAWVFLRK